MNLYSTVSDQQLNAVVSEIQNQFPTCGNRQMQGHLAACGVRVQQRRVREAQRRIDPHGSVLCRFATIIRRQYHVHGPTVAH